MIKVQMSATLSN